MSNLPVLKYPNDRLRLKAQSVLTFDDMLRQQVTDMFETMYLDHAVGLAAIQVNIQKRLFVMDSSHKQNNPYCFINPEIIYKEGEEQSEEGCLSFPGVYTKISRFKNITVKYMDETGALKETSFEGLESHCVQHEIDHLDGILFIDHLSNLKRVRLLKKYEKYQREAL